MPGASFVEAPGIVAMISTETTAIGPVVCTLSMTATKGAREVMLARLLVDDECDRQSCCGDYDHGRHGRNEPATPPASVVVRQAARCANGLTVRVMVGELAHPGTVEAG